jgi:hypothetical protein
MGIICSRSDESAVDGGNYKKIKIAKALPEKPKKKPYFCLEMTII